MNLKEDIASFACLFCSWLFPFRLTGIKLSITRIIQISMEDKERVYTQVHEIKADYRFAFLR